MTHTTCNKVDILVSALRLEGVDYNEGLMADSEGWVPSVLVRNGNRWAKGQ